MAKNQAFRGIKLLYIFLTVTLTDSACFAWRLKGAVIGSLLDILVGFFSRLVCAIFENRQRNEFYFLLQYNKFNFRKITSSRIWWWPKNAAHLSLYENRRRQVVVNFKIGWYILMHGRTDTNTHCLKSVLNNMWIWLHYNIKIPNKLPIVSIE